MDPWHAFPSYEKTTALVSRALSLNPQALAAGFVPATQLDLPQILELRKQVIGAGLSWDDSRYLAWRYHLGTPDAGRGECWVVKRGNEVLALVGTESVSVLHQGQAVDGLTAMDIAVRPDLEGVGLGVWMAMHLCETFDCVLAIGSNSNSRAMVSRVFSRLPDRRPYAHLLDFRPVLRRRWKSRWMADVIAGAAGAGMSLWRAAVSFSRDRSLRVEPLLRFDEAVDRLAEQSRTGHEVCLDRNAEFLNWRLFGNTRCVCAVWAARTGAELAGYIALCTRVSEDGNKVLVIRDFLVRAGGDGAAVLRALLCRAFEIAVTDGCDRISVIACHPENERQLRRAGFFQHRGEAETLSVSCRDASLSAAIAAGAPWHLTGANTDRDT